jgi:DNA-binding transcriptional ArsR family regulator
VSDVSASQKPDDRNLTSIADVINDPARSAMLAALAGGRALPAGELARRAGVQPRAASNHLRRLTAAGLIKVRVQGRRRYHEIVDRGQDLVGRLGIDLVALRASRRVFARACVDWTDRRVHLAGALPAAITSVFLDRGWFTRGPGRRLRVDDDFDGNIEKWLAI